jgi:ATP-dependent RNA helicase DHX29
MVLFVICAAYILICNLNSQNIGSNLPITGLAAPSDIYSAKRESNTNTPLDMSNTNSDESDSSIDPDSLIPEYITLQSRLYKQDPNIFNHPKCPNRKGIASDCNPTPDVVRLMKKLTKIEKDILFDRYEAEERWNERLTELRHESAAFLRKGITERTPKSSVVQSEEFQRKGELDIPVESSIFGDDTHEDLFGGMFASDQEHWRAETAQPTAHGNSIIILRDFGKPTGMNPRRILEEVCHARFGRHTRPASNVITNIYETETRAVR